MSFLGRRRLWLGAVVAALALVVAGSAVAGAPKKGTVGGAPTHPIGPPDEGTRNSPSRVILAGKTYLGHVEVDAYGWNPPADFGTGEADALWADVEFGAPVAGWSYASSFVPENIHRPVTIEALFWQDQPKSERSTFVGGALEPGVGRVLLSYPQPNGTGTVRADAVVSQVSGRLQQELHQSAPFGYFFATLPGTVQAKELEAIAYGAHGQKLGSIGGWQGSGL
ncbi:MAG: hypothetical protein JST59_20615 [Actinobacteria bacterium]|nr:hypothetical protein [Actinomycetota bacterium]